MEIFYALTVMAAASLQTFLETQKILKPRKRSMEELLKYTRTLMDVNIQLRFLKLILIHSRKRREGVIKDHTNHNVHVELGMNEPETLPPNPSWNIITPGAGINSSK